MKTEIGVVIDGMTRDYKIFARGEKVDPIMMLTAAMALVAGAQQEMQKNTCACPSCEWRKAMAGGVMAVFMHYGENHPVHNQTEASNVRH